MSNLNSVQTIVRSPPYWRLRDSLPGVAGHTGHPGPPGVSCTSSSFKRGTLGAAVEAWAEAEERRDAMRAEAAKAKQEHYKDRFLARTLRREADNAKRAANRWAVKARERLAKSGREGLKPLLLHPEKGVRVKAMKLMADQA